MKPIVIKLSKNYDVSPSVISNAVSSAKMIDGSLEDIEDILKSVSKAINKRTIYKKIKKWF